MLVIAAPVAIGAGTVVFALLGSSLALAFITVFVWGIGFGAVPTMVQTWIARVAPERLESAGGLVVAAFQIAITIGAAVGGVLVDTVGVQAAFIGGGIAAALAAGVLSSARVRSPPSGDGPEGGAVRRRSARRSAATGSATRPRAVGTRG